MRFKFQVRSIPDPSISIQDKSTKFFEEIRALPAPWGAMAEPTIPAIKGDLSVGIKASKFLGKGPTGDLNFHLRSHVVDSASGDDFIYLMFNPAKIDYVELIESVFCQYSVAFGAYFSEISNEEFIYSDFEGIKKAGVGSRHGLYRVPPVLYMNEDYCRRAFAITPDEVCRRLSGHVQKIEKNGSGIFLVLTYDPLPHEHMDVLCKAAKARLLT